ncbi:MAG: hypothetical protein QW568_00205 [Candidatus Anstonellaceae archaeon]
MMKSALALSVFLVALLLLGCTAKPQEASAKEGSGPVGSFFLPQSKADYTAVYAVDEGSGPVASKKVWRKDSRMRIEISSDSGGSISLYFVSGRAYSCANIGSGYSCYEITSGLEPEAAAQLSGEPDFSSAEAAEEVEIGSTKGYCFFFPYKVFEKRKQCFTEKGVLAFDQYNVTDGRAHTEYLTNLAYVAYDSDFVLPAAPQPVPKVKEN